jgi:4-hydroxy-tetrahydrodipicolinate synthase
MPTLNETASGVYVIAVTPFTDSGDLDFVSTDRLVDFYLDCGVTGITVLGMMGEAPKLTADESLAFTRHVLRRVRDAVPIVVGVSSPGFAAMGELARGVRGEGAAGVMVAPSASLRTDAQIIDYFDGVAETLREAPWVLQDFPLSTNVQIAPGVIAEIVRRQPSCVMLKHEDWPGLGKITALRDAMAKGLRRISILVGNGGLFLPEELGRGADGAMTGFAFPEMMVQVCRLAAAGEVDRAADLFDAYLPLVRYEQQPGAGLAVRKYVLAKRGLIASPALRKPGKPLSNPEVAEIERLMARQARRLAELASGSP